jgi:signal transduction histidine kinase/CheY-like chemotaxis protein
MPGLIGAGILFIYQYREARLQQERDTIQTARALMQAVDSYLLRGKAIAQALSTSDALAEHDFARFHRRAREVLALQGLGTNLVLREKSGQMLLNTAVEYGTPLFHHSVRPHIQCVFDTKQPVISDLFIGLPIKRPIMSIDVPVFIEGKVEYVLGIGILPEQFSAILEAQKLPPGWNATVFDTAGTIVGRSRSPEKFVGNKVTEPLLDAITLFREKTVDSINQEGSPVLTSFSRSSITDWGVAIGIPHRSLTEALIFSLFPVAAGVLILFGIGFILAWFMGGRIAHSVNALIVPAAALGKGDPVEMPAMHVREAAEVAAAISRAADLLSERAAAIKTRDAELLEAYRLSKFGTWYWNAKTGEVNLSDSIAEIYGVSRMPPFEEQRGTLLTVDSWEQVNSGTQQAMQTGKGFDLELQANHGAGYSIWLHFKCEVLRNESGELLAIHGTIQDVTQRKEYEEALRRSERNALEAARQAQAERSLLSAVLEAAPVAIVVADANGAILQSNALNKTLWGANQPLARDIHGYRHWKGRWADGSEKHGQLVQPHEWPMARALQGMDASYSIIEIEPFDAPSDRKIVMMSAAPVRDHSGKIISGVNAQMDITDRIKAEESLRLADKRKDEFLAMLAHELRNPLAPISAAADLLGIGGLDESRVSQVSTIIARQVKHMTGLIDDLLDVSRVTRGLVSLDMQNQDVGNIIADAIEQVRPLLDAKSHYLDLCVPDKKIFVLGDHKRLVQVMTNLLNNAAKFTAENGSVAVEVSTKDNFVNIAVSDNGIGMTPDMVTRAFELFTQGERSSDRSQGGLGIGLSLVKSLVELHGGSVEARSQGLGHGSRFSVRLPRLETGAGLSSVGACIEYPGTLGKKLKVLVVDDNVDAAKSLAMLIEAWGHQVMIENDSYKALHLAEKERPDICLLDIGLPGMHGNELARRLRARPETAGTVLVAVTGYGQDLERKNALEAGFDHHFIKPVKARQLASLLNEIRRPDIAA